VRVFEYVGSGVPGSVEMHYLCTCSVKELLIQSSVLILLGVPLCMCIVLFEVVAQPRVWDTFVVQYLSCQFIRILNSRHLEIYVCIYTLALNEMFHILSKACH